MDKYNQMCSKLDENESRQKQILELVQPFRKKFGEQAEPKARYNA